MGYISKKVAAYGQFVLVSQWTMENFKQNIKKFQFQFFFHLCFNLSFFMTSDSYGESIAMEVIQDDEVHCHQVEILFLSWRSF